MYKWYYNKQGKMSMRDTCMMTYKCYVCGLIEDV